MSYNPIPPRVWSRVQDKCSTNTDTSQLVYVPLTNSYESLSKYNYDKQMLLKGNVLQYKNNSSNLTKKQRYTQIAKGQWAGRRKCFATQSETYTNPNTSSFQRVNYVNIPFPNNIVGAPNNVSGPFQYDVPNPFGCNTTVLEDGGSLVGNTYVNPCTQEVVRTTYNQPCNLTSASDVPGPVQVLCWDPKVATWYPRQRYIMPTSGTKWPEGYKGLVSAVTPIPPILSLDAASFCPIVLSWTFNNCLPISNFYIYQNDVLVQIVPYTTTTVSITGLVPSTTYSYYIRSVSSGIESDFSNSVVITIPPIDVPTLAPIVATCPVVLNWSISYNCPVIDSFNVYQDSVLIQNVFTTSATITGLIPSTTYSYYIRSVSSGIESAISNTESVTYPAVDVPTLAPIVATCPVVLNWSVSDNCPAIDSFNVYQDSILVQNIPYPTTSATITGLVPSTTYSYYIRSVSSGIESADSNTESVTPQPFNVTGSPVILYLNNYYYIRFTTNGTITFLENINNLNLICVGGGGGGGGGINGNEDPFGSIVGGGGGGSGGIGHLQNVAVNNIQYNVTVGSGGLGLTGNNSGVSGTSTSFISSTSINYLTSTGGIGGNGQYGTYPNPGLMGTCTSIYSPTIYTSANGGVGYNNNTPQDSTNGSDTIPAMPITTSSGVNYLFGGGGGGGGGDPRTNGGKAGLNGIGGIAKASSVNNGENAINPGAGGGGSGDINEGGKGGDGGDGVLLIYFYYTC